MPVVVIGAGMSGLLAGIRLQQAGIPFTIVEKNADVGGTWFENSYPDCRVDNPSHLYSYSFEPNHEWPNHFSPQPVLLAYFQDVADKHGLRAPHPLRDPGRGGGVRRGDARVWRVRIKDKAGQHRDADAPRAVISRRRPAEPAALPGHPGRAATSRARRSTPPAGATTST